MQASLLVLPGFAPGLHRAQLADHFLHQVSFALGLLERLFGAQACAAGPIHQQLDLFGVPVASVAVVRAPVVGLREEPETPGHAPIRTVRIRDKDDP